MSHDTGDQKPDIILNSPVGSKPAVYKWPLTYVSKGQKIDEIEEIIETIRWVAHEYLEFKPAIENLLMEQANFRSYECIKSLCDKYNKIPDYVMKMNKGTSVALNTSSRASQGLLKHIIQQVYNYAVVEPTELNKYSPFSSETYGETSFEFMAQLIDRNQFRPREGDIFIDLGSGVGHLVLQMAASVECKKCYGIEIADVPAGYAKLMEERFKFWMNWHGKTYSDFELFHGDFFEKKYSDIIKSSNYIFVNNFAFKPDVDHKLKQRFLDLKDGTQILSSKPFCSPKNRVNERNLADIGSIMHVVEIQPDQKKDTVSWTPKPLPYYLHVLDGSRIERYYERQKRKQGGLSTDKGKPSKRRKSSKIGSDSQSDDSEPTYYGPTTRKAWSDWCNSTSTNSIQNAPPTALYSFSKTTEPSNGSNSAPKIPNIVIKVKPTLKARVPAPIQKANLTPDPSTIQASPLAPNLSQTQTLASSISNKVTSPCQTITASSIATAPVQTNSLIQKQKIKVEDDTGKKLRQRNTEQKSEQASSKPEAPPKSSSHTVKKQTASSKKKVSSLDLLHAKTVESVATSAQSSSQPAPGCENHNLDSILETPSLPKVVIKDLSMFTSAFLGPKNIEKFVESTKAAFATFSGKLQRSNVKEALLRSIEHERSRNNDLRLAEEELTSHIRILEDRIPKAMKVHCDKLGISNSQRSVINHLGALLKKHQELSSYQLQLEVALQPTQRLMIPPVAHSNSNQRLTSPYRTSTSSATLDLSVKQAS